LSKRALFSPSSCFFFFFFFFCLEESNSLITLLTTAASLPSGYYAPPQTPPVVINNNAAWNYYFIVQDYVGRTFVWAGNANNGDFLASGIPTMARPDRFGFFRNCITRRPLGTSAFFPVPSASTLAFNIIETTSINPDLAIPIVSNITGIGASDLVFYTPTTGITHLVFVAWRNAYLNDVYAFNGQASALNSQLGANATHLSAESGRLFWNTITARDSVLGIATQRIYYSLDPALTPIGQRLLEVTGIEIFKLDLAEMFVPSPYAVVQDILLFTNWGQIPDDVPSVQVWSLAPSPALQLTVPRSSVAWTMRISQDIVAWVGPSEYFANADDFVNAALFSAYEYATATPGTIFNRLDPAQTHVYAAFAYPGEPRTMWAHNGAPNTGPSGFYPMFEYKSNGGFFNPITPLLECPGVETWVTYVRFPTDYNGTHMFFLGPSASGPTVYAQRANEPGTL
jgi:hypothetical protein